MTNMPFLLNKHQTIGILNNQGQHACQWVSLKYRIHNMTRTRAAIMEPIIHLFLLILLDMVVRIFLLLLMLSSTPWSCKSMKQYCCIFSYNYSSAVWLVKQNYLHTQTKDNEPYFETQDWMKSIPCYVHEGEVDVVDANPVGLKHPALLFPAFSQ